MLTCASEITSLNIELNEKDKRIRQLRLDKERVEAKIKGHDEEKLKVTRTLQAQVDEKADRIAKLLKRLEDLEQNSGQASAQLAETYQQQLSELNKRQEQELSQAEHQMSDLQSDLQQLDQFKKTHRLKEDELEAERLRFEGLQRQLQQAKEQGRQEQVRLKQRIEEQYAKFLEDFKQRAQAEAEKNISEIERNIQAQNQRMEDEVLLQQFELEFVEHRTKNLSDENQKYRADLRTKTETVEEFARKQFAQNNKIRVLKAKIELLEARLAEVVQAFEKEKELLKFQNAQVIKEQSDELRALRESVRVKGKEVAHLKALCQMILDQRSDIEQFFLEALEQVKEEKRRKLDAQHSLVDPASQLVRPRRDNEQSEKAQVALADLDWEDRERILRLMFSKMNAGQPASHWRVAAEGNDGRSKKNTRGALDQSFREEDEYD